MNKFKVDCPYCGKTSDKVKGDVIYPNIKKLQRKTYYLCKSCDAYVGCHPNTEKPLGRLADKRLREAKQKTHSHFDRLWHNDYMTRTEAYKWLATQLDIPNKECHIGMFDVETCEKASAICISYYLKIKNKS